jgi:hypothetical protein
MPLNDVLFSLESIKVGRHVTSAFCEFADQALKRLVNKIVVLTGAIVLSAYLF